MKMSPEMVENVSRNREMSAESLIELDDEDLNLSLDTTPKTKKAELKKRKRQQGIIGLIKQNPNITVEEMAEKFNVNERTIYRDIEILKNIVEHVGPTKGGYWVIKY